MVNTDCIKSKCIKLDCKCIKLDCKCGNYTPFLLNGTCRFCYTKF